MRIFRNDRKDFSQEVILSVGILLEGINAMSLIARKMDDTLQIYKLKETTFNKTRKALYDASRMMKKVVETLESCSEQYLLKAACNTKNPDEIAERWDTIMYHSNDIVQLLLLYQSRVDRNEGNRDRIKKSIRRLAPDEGYDIEEVVDMFKLK